jgi:septum formation protein
MAQCMDETQAPRLILGSGSPRRLEILAVLGITPDAVTPPDIDETPQKAELPRPYCMRMAREKALAVNAAAGDLVLSADTTVAAGRRILGKPEDEAEAVAFLRLLSGRRHRVITALAIRKDAQVWAADVVTAVKMKRLSDAEISAYIRSGEWQGKAGGSGGRLSRGFPARTLRLWGCRLIRRINCCARRAIHWMLTRREGSHVAL